MISRMSRLRHIRETVRRALDSDRTELELPGVDPEAGYLLLCGSGAPRVLGVLSSLAEVLPPLALTVRAEDMGAFDEDEPLGILELQPVPKGAVVLARSLASRPWALEHVAERVISTARETSLITAAEHPFTRMRDASRWLGIGMQCADDGTPWDEHSASLAGMLVVAGASLDEDVTLECLAILATATSERIARKETALIEQLLSAESPEDIARLATSGIAQLGSLGRLEQLRTLTMLGVPGARGHRELVSSLATRATRAAESAARTLLDFQGSLARAPLDPRRSPDQDDTRRPVLLRDRAGELAPAALEAWQLVAVDLATGDRNTHELATMLLLDFPELPHHAVARFFEDLAERGLVRVID